MAGEFRVPETLQTMNCGAEMEDLGRDFAKVLHDNLWELMTGEHDLRWYIAKCEPQRERMAMAFLKRDNEWMEPYSPFEKWRVCRSGRWYDVERPLFRGYIFVRAPAHADGWAAIQGSKHILGLVKLAGSETGEPAEVPSVIIDALRSRESAYEFDHARAAEARRRLLKARRRGSVPLHSHAARERMDEILRVVDA